jgi:hypothetical protein
MAQAIVEGRRVVASKSDGHVRPPGGGVGQSAGLSKMAEQAFENEMGKGQEI